MLLCSALYFGAIQCLHVHMEMVVVCSRNFTVSTIRLFADDCIIYREVKNNNDKENLQTDLNRLAKWAVENAMKINRTVR
jgi:hypothetical protein